MSQKEKSLRDKYFANEIFRIGDIVEDITTGQEMKILDRGSNYVTVASGDKVIKKWLNEVTEKHEIETPIVSEESSPNSNDFKLLDSGQIKLFGHETRNFDQDISQTLIEQFKEFDDLYSKHQIIKCLDFALQEESIDATYDLLDKVEKFASKHSMEVPFIVEGMKTDIERRRIIEILASIADITPTKSNYETAKLAVKALKAKYQTRKQWEVLWPFFKLAQNAGIMGITHSLPYTFGPTNDDPEDIKTEEIIIDTLENNIDLLGEDLEIEDIYEAFSDDDFVQIDEVLSFDSRLALGRKMARHEPILTQRKDRAMNRAASTSVLMSRARKLAETMLKRRMFHKAPSDMSRQDKERFEAGATKRRALVAKLAQKLMPKVRALQSARLHHTNTPVQHTHDHKTAAIAASGAA